MPIYTIPVSWSLYGTMEIEANCLDEAIEIAYDSELPYGDYTDGSLCVDEEYACELAEERGYLIKASPFPGEMSGQNCGVSNIYKVAAEALFIKKEKEKEKETKKSDS